MKDEHTGKTDDWCNKTSYGSTTRCDYAIAPMEAVYWWGIIVVGIALPVVITCMAYCGLVHQIDTVIENLNRVTGDSNAIAG